MMIGVINVQLLAWIWMRVLGLKGPKDFRFWARFLMLKRLKDCRAQGLEPI